MKAPLAEFDIEELLTKLPINAKIDLLAGSDLWHTVPIPSFGIPKIRVSDGPNGVRGSKVFNGTPASCFPCATGLAAAFDVELAREIGGALGDECHAKGAHVLLGPTSNIQRSPLGGRGFESFSEDPHLNGLITAAWINGLQAKGVSPALKHFACNDQEFERNKADSVVAARALREVYLEPFRLAMKFAKPTGIMTSYNRINGLHCSENDFLVKKVLREEWGFDGVVMSDWFGTYSTKEAVEAGLDLEMPGPTVMRGETLMRQYASGKVKEADIDERVRGILKMVNMAIRSGIPFEKEEEMIDTPEMRALLRKAAQGAVVLLKNEKQILPIKAGLKKIAVIGTNAKVPVASGGGSASLLSTYTVSPLDAITAAAKEIGAEVEFATGCSAYMLLPLIDPYLSNVKLDFFLEPVPDFLSDIGAPLPTPFHSTAATTSYLVVVDGVPIELVVSNSQLKYTATFTPDVTGEWKFTLSSIGYSTLWVDGKLVADNTPAGSYKRGEMFFAIGSDQVFVSLQLEAGKEYKIEARQWKDPNEPGPTSFPIKSGLRIGALLQQSEEQSIAQAAALAAKSELAIVVVGTNGDWESEGHDRKTIKLPGANDELVKAVLAANPNTIVVTQSGTPVAMPWLSDASTVVHAFFGGNEVGNGMTDVIFGKVNPSGKLPLSFPKRLQDNPSYHSFGITSETPGKVLYSEGVYVGYKHYDHANIEPLFPFGYGLSYSTFDISSLSVSSVSAGGDFTVSATIKNTGSVDGAEAVQVYVAPPSEGRITSPLKALHAFEKVHLKAGESKSVKLSIGKEAFSYWDEKEDSWVAPAGDYKVLVGNSSVSVKEAGQAKLAKTFKWRGL